MTIASPSATFPSRVGRRARPGAPRSCPRRSSRSRRHHRDPIALLHHAVVDRDGRALGKHAARASGRRRASRGRADHVELLAQDRHRAPDLLEDHVRAEHEDPGVPEVPAVGEVARRGARVRLLDEALDLERLQPRLALLAARRERAARPSGSRSRSPAREGRIPIVAIAPRSASCAAAASASRNAGGLAMWWSAGSIAITPSGSRARDVERGEPDARGGVPRARLHDELRLRELRQHPPRRCRVLRSAHHVRALRLRERRQARDGGGE